MPDFPVIESARLRFVELSAKYAERIFEYASNEEVTKYVAWNRHETIDDTYEFLKWSRSQSEDLNHFDFGLIIKASGEFIGTTGTSNFLPDEKSIDFGYVLNKKYWGNGFATEAAREIRAFAFQLDDVEYLRAYVFDANLPSRRVLEKCGFINRGPAKCPSLASPDERVALKYELNKNDYLENPLISDFI
ncbi:MAG: GNAT family N-acetyltransferase [bacterium]